MRSSYHKMAKRLKALIKIKWGGLDARRFSYDGADYYFSPEETREVPHAVSVKLLTHPLMSKTGGKKWQQQQKKDS